MSFQLDVKEARVIGNMVIRYGKYVSQVLFDKFKTIFSRIQIQNLEIKKDKPA